MRTSSISTVVLTALLWTESKSFSIQSQTRINKVKALHNSHSHEEGGVGENKENRLKKYGQVLLDRSDTMKAAGFHDICKENKDEYPPLQAGAKTNITLFLLALGYKWYRSIFINKLAIWERQPQWNTVITSKEDEEKANLEAMTCNECGSTIFIAKGRKWFQMPNGYKCYCCGATGEDAFTNTREDLLEEIEDDYFDYEKPLDFVTAAERRKLMKQAGGDEQKANELLTQSSAASAPPAEGEISDKASGDGETGEKKKKKKKKKKSKKKKKKVEGDAGDAPVAESTPATKDATVAESKPTPTKEVKVEPKKETKTDDFFDDLDALGMD